MPAYFFCSEPGAAELRRLARRESGRVCQRVLMIANLLEGMEHEEAARLAGLSRSAAYEWHNRYEEDGIEKRTASRDCVIGRVRVDSHG
jgi:Winged helix-turn helix